MDSNEEFEFKPLTEGLGFHSKKIDLANEVKKSKIFSEMVSNNGSRRAAPAPPYYENPSADFHNKTAKELPTIPIMASEETQATSEKIFKTPLPRVEVPENNKVSKKDVIDELIESFKKPVKSFVEEKKPDVIFDKIPAEEKINGVKTAWALAPFLVDMMMVAAFFLVGLIIALYVTKVDIIDFVFNAVGNLENMLVVPAILFMMICMYTIFTRIFIGGTIGEMVFDMQLGTSKEQKAPFYGFRVLARLLLVISTGFVTLPLISWIFRGDFAGKLTKLQLIKKK
jgi:hypothetical protein